MGGGGIYFLLYPKKGAHLEGLNLHTTFIFLLQRLSQVLYQQVSYMVNMSSSLKRECIDVNEKHYQAYVANSK